MKRGIQSVAALLGMLVTLPGLCQTSAPPETAPAEAPAPAADAPAPVVDRSVRLKEIDAAIAEQAGRRRAAKGGFVAAGVVLGVGVIASAIQTANDAEAAEQRAYENGESTYEVKMNWAGFLIGALIATPIVLASVETLRDANHRTQDLNRERTRLNLGLADAGGTTTLTLRYEF